VLGIDSSPSALALAEDSARLNGVSATCSFLRGDVFHELGRLHAKASRFDLVVADPPSFVKSRRELGVGLRGYRKLVSLAAACVKPGGFLFVASCSHHVERGAFNQAVAAGLSSTRREARILVEGSAAPDHPVHAALPESAYLKYLVLQLDASGPQPEEKRPTANSSRPMR